MSKLNTIQASLTDQSPDEILSWALDRFADHIVFATSLGREDQALLSMIAKASAPPPRIVFLDTGRHFEATYALLEENRRAYDLPIEVLAPDSTDLEALVSEHGPQLFRNSVPLRELCCDIRKVRPLHRALGRASAWITGLRRFQSAARTDVHVVDRDQTNGRYKINPLWDWSDEQLDAFLDAEQPPLNSLHTEGFPSIGCAPCTRAVRPGESARAGRWWWEQETGKECGIHTTGSGLVRATPGDGEVES